MVVEELLGLNMALPEIGGVNMDIVLVNSVTAITADDYASGNAYNNDKFGVLDVEQDLVYK